MRASTASDGPAGARIPRPAGNVAALLDIIGPTTHGGQDDAAAAPAPFWIAVLSLGCALGILLIALGDGQGRRDHADIATWLYWSGVAVIGTPVSFRLAWPAVARGERLFLSLLLAEFMLLIKTVAMPTHFEQFDEILHWVSSYDILYRHQLFLPNSLLPTSPYYPALEIFTTAFANLARLTVFPAAMIVVAAFRAVFITGLFLLIEKLTGRHWIAAIGCAVYAGCPNFLMFDSSYSYETLGVVFLMLVILAEIRVGNEPYSPGRAVVPGMLLACLAVTHHVTAGWCALFMVSLVILEYLRRGGPEKLQTLSTTTVIAGLAVALPLLWACCVPGNPVISYLGPPIEGAAISIVDRLAGHGAAPAHALFQSDNGEVQPLWKQAIGVVSTLFLVIGLSTGFFRALTLRSPGHGWYRVWETCKRHWPDSRIVLMALAAFGFPVSVALRLSPAGWEIGFRMGAIVYIPVALVVGTAIVHFWHPRFPSRLATFAIGSVLATIVFGGVVLGAGPHSVRGPYRVEADQDSIEPMGIDAAKWTQQWLGQGNRFSSDRVNDTLLAIYGQQDVISSLDSGVEISRVFFNRAITPDTLYPIRAARIGYLLVDLRLTTGKALFGQYYDTDDDANYLHGRVPNPNTLLKFDHAASRVFDNGYIVIYGVGDLR